MTEELTKTAPGNHGPIYETDLYDFAGWLTTRPGVMAVGSSCEAGPMAEAVGEYIKTFPELFALTQRPAAQTEREAFEARVVAEAGEGAVAKWLGTDGYENTRVQDNRLGWVWCLEWQARAPLPAEAVRQATAEEVFLAEVLDEVLRARAKFPGDRVMGLALAEKFGELIKAVLDESPDRVRREAVQTAAMCVRLVLDGDGSVKEWMARGLAPLFQPKEGGQS